MPLNQKKLRATLARIALVQVTAFAERHKGEQFYGFAFDCNADYCQVLLCLNTEQDLQDRAKKLKEAPPKSFLPKFDKMLEEKYGVKPKPLYDDKTMPEIVEQLRWETGDWKYQGFYNCDDNPEWAALATDIAEEEDSDSNREIFLEAVCHVLPDFQAAFDRLNCTSNFRGLVIDHDESVETAWRRLEKVQSQVA
jgi:hypothetical protein